MSSEPLIELEGVSVVRDGRPILHSVSLRVDVGESVAILGPNGCGKSTLLRLLTREIHPHGGEGSVRILGEGRWRQRELRTVLGIVGSEPKEPFLGEPTVFDLVLSGLFGTFGVLAFENVTEEHRVRAWAALERVGMTSLADRFVETLSLGETRRAWVARALVCRPKALVLDEPTTGLDLIARALFLRMVEDLRTPDHGVILVTHHFEELPADHLRVILMAEGRIIADGPADEVFTPANLSRAYGCPLDVRFREGAWDVRASFGASQIN